MLLPSRFIFALICAVLPKDSPKLREVRRMKDHAKNSGSPLVRLASFIVDKRSLVFLLTIHRYHFLCILLQLGGGGKRFGGLSAR